MTRYEQLCEFLNDYSLWKVERTDKSDCISYGPYDLVNQKGSCGFHYFYLYVNGKSCGMTPTQHEVLQYRMGQILRNEPHLDMPAFDMTQYE